MNFAHSIRQFAVGVRGELRKALSPTTAIIFVLAGGVLLASISFAASFADQQADVLPNVVAMREQVVPACLTNLDDVTDVCVASRIQDQSANDFEAGAAQLGAIGNSYATVPGAVRFATHHWATTIGWIIVGLIAAFHVAGEWTNGSVGVTAQSVGSRARFVALKIASTWIIAIAGLAVVAVFLALSRPLYATDGLIANADLTGTVDVGTNGSWTSWSVVLGDVAITSLILLGVSAVAVAVAVLVKRPVPTAFAVISGLIAMFLAGPASWLPSQAIAKWLDFNDVNNGLTGDHLLWSYPGVKDSITDPVAAIDVTSGISVMLVLAVAVVTAGTITAVNARKVL